MCDLVVYIVYVIYKELGNNRFVESLRPDRLLPKDRTGSSERGKGVALTTCSCSGGGQYTQDWTCYAIGLRGVQDERVFCLGWWGWWHSRLLNPRKK